MNPETPDPATENMTTPSTTNAPHSAHHPELPDTVGTDQKRGGGMTFQYPPPRGPPSPPRPSQIRPAN